MQINEVIPTFLTDGEAYRADYTINDVDKVCKDLKVRKTSRWIELIQNTANIRAKYYVNH